MLALLAFVVSRRTLLWVAVAALLAGLGWWFFADSDEAKIRARIDQIASAVETKADENMAFRALRLRRVFEEGLEPNASLRAPELQDTSGVKELAMLAASVPRFYGELDVSIGKTDVHVEPAANQARATALVTVSGRMGGELRRDERSVVFVLRKRDGDWRIELIDVAQNTR